MTSTSGTGSGWRGAVKSAVAGSVLAVGLVMGVGAPTAQADVLDDISQLYDTGAGGGQVANLVHNAVKLRALGYRPSRSNLKAIEAALKYRPNEGPLVDALQDTVAYQRKIKAQSEAAQSSPPAQVGTGQLPPGAAVPSPDRPGGIQFGVGGGETFEQPVG